MEGVYKMRFNPIYTCPDCNCDLVELRIPDKRPAYYNCPDCGLQWVDRDLESLKDEKAQRKVDERRGK